MTEIRTRRKISYNRNDLIILGKEEDSLLSSKEDGAMKKNTRRFLALFMALAILAAYSFSPQNLTAFAAWGPT